MNYNCLKTHLFFFYQPTGFGKYYLRNNLMDHIDINHFFYLDNNQQFFCQYKIWVFYHLRGRDTVSLKNVSQANA